MKGLLPKRVVVTGESMLPLLEPGDRLLVVPSVRLRPGRLVALSDPRDPTRMIVKRVTSVSRAGLDVRGDNPDASTDSRQFGLVPRRNVKGAPVYRYAPSHRSGRIRNP